MYSHETNSIVWLFFVWFVSHTKSCFKEIDVVNRCVNTTTYQNLCFPVLIVVRGYFGMEMRGEWRTISRVYKYLFIQNCSFWREIFDIIYDFLRPFDALIFCIEFHSLRWPNDTAKCILSAATRSNSLSLSLCSKTSKIHFRERTRVNFSHEECRAKAIFVCFHFACNNLFTFSFVIKIII